MCLPRVYLVRNFPWYRISACQHLSNIIPDSRNSFKLIIEIRTDPAHHNVVLVHFIYLWWFCSLHCASKWNMSATWPQTDSCLCGALVSAFDLETARHQCNRGHRFESPGHHLIFCFLSLCVAFEQLLWWCNENFPPNYSNYWYYTKP